MELHSGTLHISYLTAGKLFSLTEAKTQRLSNLKLQRWIAIASSLLLIAKFTAYYLTHSVSILTDAMESIVNVAAGFIGLYSLYVAAKPRDRDRRDLTWTGRCCVRLQVSGLLRYDCPKKQIFHSNPRPQLSDSMSFCWSANSSGVKYTALLMVAQLSPKQSTSWPVRRGKASPKAA